MKTYIVYDGAGNEASYIQATGHNTAEELAKKLYGEKASVEYTEISAELEKKLFGK